MRSASASASAFSLELHLDDDELVAPQARQCVAAADAGAKTLRRLLKEAIAGLVTERIVDRLEAIEIEQQDGEPAAPYERASRRAWSRRSWNSMRLGKTGQRIVLRQVKNMRFVAFSIGNVGRRPDEAAARHGIVLDLQMASLGADPVEAPVPGSRARRRGGQVGTVTPTFLAGFYRCFEPHIDTRQEGARRVAAELKVASIAGH